MIYRLGTQFLDMVVDVGGILSNGRPTPERMKALRDVAAARRIVRKLENLLTILGE